MAAAVILPADTRVRGLRDSKQLLREDRERLAKVVERKALAIAIEEVDSETIDRINIYQASRLAMTTAVKKLSICPDHLLIDALRLDLEHAQTSGEVFNIGVKRVVFHHWHYPLSSYPYVGTRPLYYMRVR